jgi:hypothetical protein
LVKREKQNLSPPPLQLGIQTNLFTPYRDIWTPSINRADKAAIGLTNLGGGGLSAFQA